MAKPPILTHCGQWGFPVALLDRYQHMGRFHGQALYTWPFRDCVDPAIPDIAVAQGKSLKDQLVGTWIYVSSTGKRDDGSAVDRPPAQGALTYTADGHFHFITVRTTVPKYASNDPSRPSPEQAMAVASGVVAYTGTYNHA